MNTDNSKEALVCANCGKKGDDVNNTCNKCNMVKYCNAACKKKHRHKHNQDCKKHVRLAVEHAAKLHDEKLFQQPPPEDCPICFERMPSLGSGCKYQSCCGKVICSGCSHAPVYDNQGNEVEGKKKCPFCRTLRPADEEIVERLRKRAELNDPFAVYNIGVYHRDGINGFPQDYSKALELWHRAAELGYAAAYNSIGIAYVNGEGVEVEKKKSRHYYELAAIGGNKPARHNLGRGELQRGNLDRALKHFVIAIRGGYHDSLNMFKQLYSKGYATKEDYTKALQSYQTFVSEVKSVQRDEAAAAHEYYRYY